MQAFADQYGRTIALPDRSGRLGRALVAEPVLHAGLTFGLPEVPRRLVEAIEGYQAELVSGLSRSAAIAITQALRRGALEGRNSSK